MAASSKNLLGPTGGIARARAAQQGLAEYRRDFRDMLQLSGQYSVQSVRALSQTEAFTEALIKQKVGVRELWRERGILNDVLKEQLALQKASIGFAQKDSMGRLDADVIIPRNAASQVASMTQRLGYYNQLLGSVADQTIKWGKNTQWAGRQLMTGFTLPIGAAAVATGAMAFQVDKALTNIVKVYGDASTAATTSNEQIRAESMATAKQVAANYGQSVKDTLEITAQLAAQGQTGEALQEMTAQVSRARLLGELDLQDALKATITLQSAYQLSTQGVTDAFNYMNSMENQTNLTMQDFVEGIPKVSGIMKSMGVSIQDTGVLLAAFKSAGIDANEGATALKSIAFHGFAPSKQGLDTFLKNTNQDLHELGAQADGQIIPLLQEMSKAMNGLSKQQKIDTIADVFGIHQGSKAMTLMSQLTDGGKQMATAFDVAKQSTQQWADTADRELATIQGSLSNQLMRAWETLKADMAETGKVFLPIATKIIKWFDAMVKRFNGMGEGTKKFLLVAAGIAALAGPIIMLVGLFANLIGNVAKFGSFLSGLVLKFRVMDAEERATILANKAMANSMDTEAASAARLTMGITELTSALVRFQKEQADLTIANMGIGGGQFWQSNSGKTEGKMVTRDKKGRPRLAGKGQIAAERDRAHSEALIMNPSESARVAKNAAEAEASSAATAKNWGKIATNGAALATGAGFMASMATDSGTMANNMANVLMVASMIGPQIAKLEMFKQMGTYVRGMSSELKGKTIPLLGRTGTLLKGFGAAMLGPWGVALAVLTGGFLLFNHMVDSANKKALEQGTNIADSAKTYADVIGFTYTEVGTKIDAAGNKVVSFQSKIDDFREKNKDAYNDIFNFQGTDAEKMNRAIQEGLKVAMHGGSKAAAEEAAAMALKIMGAKFDEAELKAKVAVEIDFGDPQEVASKAQQALSDAMANAAKGNGGKSFMESVGNIFGKGDTIGGTQESQIRSQVKGVWQQYRDANEAQKSVVFDQISASIEKSSTQTYEMLSQKYASNFANLHIKTFKDFAKYVNGNGSLANSKGGGPSLGLDPAEVRQVQQQTDALKIAASEIAKLENVKIKGKNFVDVDSLKEAVGALDGTKKGLVSAGEAEGRYNAAILANEKAMTPYTKAQQLAVLNVWRHAAGLQDATSLEQGFGEAVARTADSLIASKDAMDQARGARAKFFNSNFDYAGEAKTIMSDANSYMFGVANDIAQEQAQNNADAVSNYYDNVAGNLDKKIEKWQTAWDNKEEGLKNRQKARQDNITNYYDKRINAVKAAIDAEKKAEDTRQKIFEAEKTRISRMSEMYSKNIDLSGALNSGKMDDAARIANDIRSTQQGWSADDAANSSKSASDRRVAGLEGKQNNLEAAKKKRLDALDALDKAEQKAYDKQKKREQKRWDARKKAVDADRKHSEKASASKSAAEQRAMNAELAALQAFVPRNEAELKAHTARVEAVYSKYGVNLKAQGSAWGNVVGDALYTSTSKAAQDMKSNINWGAMGQTAAKEMVAGAFGMSLNNFMKWISTGELPKNYGPAKVNKKTGIATIDSGQFKGKKIPFHKGGRVGMDSGARTGYSSSQSRAPGEVDTRLLVGESVLNRKATKTLGHGFVENANKGRLTLHSGGTVNTGMATSMYAGIGAGIKSAMMAGMVSAAMARSSRESVNSETGGYYSGGAATPHGKINWGNPDTAGYAKNNIMQVHAAGQSFWVNKNAAGYFTGFVNDLVSKLGYHPSSIGGYNNRNIRGSGHKSNHAYGAAIDIDPSKNPQVFGRTAPHAIPDSVVPVARKHNLGWGGEWHNQKDYMHFEVLGAPSSPTYRSVPGMRTGGFTLGEGYAKLHKAETVLTAPLSQDLKDGIQNLDGGSTYEYTLTVNLNGPVSKDVDIQKSVEKAMENVNRRKGVNRKVGNNN